MKTDHSSLRIALNQGAAASAAALLVFPIRSIKGGIGMKRIVAMLLVLVLVLCVCPLPVSAQAPETSEGGEPFPVNPFLIVVFLIICGLGILLTVVVEWSIAKLFNLGYHYKKLIIWTNVISQIILRILQLSTFLLMPKSMTVIAWCSIYLPTLEILSYLAEFLVYIRRMRDVSWKRCLLYTITANTALLIVGILLLFILL
jgi:hypothetical protein